MGRNRNRQPQEAPAAPSAPEETPAIEPEPSDDASDVVFELDETAETAVEPEPPAEPEAPAPTEQEEAVAAIEADPALDSPAEAAARASSGTPPGPEPDPAADGESVDDEEEPEASWKTAARERVGADFVELAPGTTVHLNGEPFVLLSHTPGLLKGGADEQVFVSVLVRNPESFRLNKGELEHEYNPRTGVRIEGTPTSPALLRKK